MAMTVFNLHLTKRNYFVVADDILCFNIAFKRLFLRYQIVFNATDCFRCGWNENKQRGETLLNFIDFLIYSLL